MCTVSVRSRVSNYSVDRKTHLTSQGTTNQKHGTAAFCLEEAATTTVIRTGDEAVIDALVGHLLGLSGCIHVAEAGQRLNLNVINTTGNNQVSLAQSNLVNALFDGYRSGCTSTDWVNHRTIAANQRLHGVRCNNVWQSFLQDVGRTVLAEQTGNEYLVQGFHAADTGTLRGCNLTWVDYLQQLSWAETCLGKRIDCGDQVPYGHAVESIQHVIWDAPLGSIEVVRHLARNGTGQGCLAWNTRGCALEAGDFPLAVNFTQLGEAWVCFFNVACFLLRCNGEDNIAVQEYGGQVNGALVNHVVLVGQGTDTGASNNLIAEAVVDIRFVDFVALFVVPGWTWVICPLHQTGHPCQLQNASCSQVNSTVALQAVFCLEAGTAGSPGGNLADTCDDNHVIKVGGDIANFAFGKWCGKLDLARVWQSSDGCLFCLESAVRFVRSGRTLCLFADLRCKLRDGNLGRTKATGQIQLEWSLGCLCAGLSGCQRHQLRRNLLWVPDVDASLFCSWNQDVVATHQGSTGNPANLCLR